MDSNEAISSIPDPNSATVITIESEVKQPAAEQQQRKEGLATKVRQKIDAAGKRIQGVRPRKVSVPDLSNLTEQSQVRLIDEYCSLFTMGASLSGVDYAYRGIDSIRR